MVKNMMNDTVKSQGKASDYRDTIKRDSNRNTKQNFKGCGAEIAPLPEGENI
jgi:hypothetical protein